MEEQQKNIDDLFRDALSGYREAPPAAVWQRIARQLDKQDGRRRAGWWRWPWVALMLALIVGAGWWGLHSHESSTQSIAASAPQAPSRDVLNTEGMQQTRKDQDPLPAIDNRSPDARRHHHAQSETNRIINPANPSITIPGNAATDDAATAETSLPDPSSAEQPPLPRQTQSLEPLLTQAPKLLSGGAAAAPHGFATASVKPILLPQQARSAGESLPRLSASATRAPNASASAAAPDALKAMPLRPTNAAVPALNASRQTNLMAAAPMQQPTPFAAEIPGFVPELPFDERMQEVNLAPLNPARFYAAATPNNVPAPATSPASVSLPTATEVASTTSGGLPQPIVDPLPLRKPAYVKSVSIAALAGGAYSPSLRGYYDAGLRAMLQLSSRIALGIQPSFGIGNLSSVRLTEPASYYRSEITVDSFRTTDPSPSVRHAIDTIHNYVVQEQLDSIVMAGLVASGHFWEISVPIILRYSLNAHWYAYGGPSLQFGGKIATQAEAAPKVFTTHRRDSLAQSQALPAAAFEHYFGTPDLPAYSSYRSPDVTTEPSLRLGYIFGVGYGSGRIFGEASIRQQLSGYNDLPEPLQPVFAQPRVHLSIGYLLFDSKKKSTAPLQ